MLYLKDFQDFVGKEIVGYFLGKEIVGSDKERERERERMGFN